MADTFSLQLVAYNDVVEPGYYGWRFMINCKQTRNYLQNTSLIEWEIKQEPNGLNIVYFPEVVFVKRKCEQKGPKKVSTFSTRFHVVSNAFPKYQMLTTVPWGGHTLTSVSNALLH